MSRSPDEAPCTAMAPLLHALADAELDAANALRCESHLRSCPRCAAAFAAILEMRELLRRPGLRHRAPAALQARIAAALDAAAAQTAGQPAAPAARAWSGRPAGTAAARGLAAWRRWTQGARLPALALAAGLAALVLVVGPQLPSPDGSALPALRREVVAGHVRSLLVPGRLTDVAASDRHTVKPWFAGRLDFSPPVPDLADAGFPLVGGRLDYLDDRLAAALVYRRRAHVITVYVLRAAARTAPAEPRPVAADPARERGHAVLHWPEGGLAFWAVSDLDAAELELFARLFAARARAPGPA